MRYQNAAELLPAELLEALQGYLDGGYLYIPRRAEHRRAWGERTRRKEETLARQPGHFPGLHRRSGRGRAVRPLFSRPKEHPADSHPGPPGPAGAIVLRRSEARSGAAFFRYRLCGCLRAARSATMGAKARQDTHEPIQPSHRPRGGRHEPAGRRAPRGPHPPLHISPYSTS